MFKGFGKKNKLSNDDLQFFVANSLATIMSNDPPKKIGLGQNQVFYFAPAKEIQRTDSDMTWQLVSRDMRWDLLNPGQPNLVPLIAVCSHGVRTMEDEAKNTVTAVYDRAIKQLTLALSLDSCSKEDAAIICTDLATREVVEASEQTTDALSRLTQWSTYKLCKNYLPEDRHEDLLPKIADEIGLEHKLLQAI